MSTQDKSSSKKTDQKINFLKRLNLRFPWLKLAAVIVVGIIIILDLLDLTISKTGELSPYVKVPMSNHIKATERQIKEKKLVALTFDDGPSPDTTPELLDNLTKKDAVATFFVLGSMADANPDIVKRIRKNGHDVASHTMYHQNLVMISYGAAADDIGIANGVFTQILGHSPELTRPPYGNLNNNVVELIDTPIILWSVDPQDWLYKDPDIVISNVMAQVHDGAIILLHDIYPSTVEAVPALIDSLRESGYEVATISELTKARGVHLTTGEIYYNFEP